MRNNCMKFFISQRFSFNSLLKEYNDNEDWRVNEFRCFFSLIPRLQLKLNPKILRMTSIRKRRDHNFYSELKHLFMLSEVRKETWMLTEFSRLEKRIILERFPMRSRTLQHCFWPQWYTLKCDHQHTIQVN